MAMTSRQRVLTAFEHEEPDRVPAWCGASAGFWDQAKRNLGLDDEGLRRRLGDDFRRVFARYAGPEIELPPGATSVTPFGVFRGGIEYGQPLNHPLAGAMDELMANDETRKRLADCAREVTQRFAVPVILKKWQAVLDRVIHGDIGHA